MLIQVPTETQVVLIAAHLQEHGIPAQVTAEIAGGFRAEAPGRVKVLVRPGVLENTRAVVAASAFFQHATGSVAFYRSTLAIPS